MIRFIHTADIHYGMENYGIIDPATGIHTRLLDFDQAFNFCVDTAIQETVDFFLIAGDAYKTTTPSPTQQQLFFRALLRLHAAQIPVVIVIGNHDNPLSFGKSNALDILNDLPLNSFQVLSKPASIRLHTKSGDVQIVGIPWPTRNMLSLSTMHHFKSVHELNEQINRYVTEIIKKYAASLDPQLPAILTAHLTVTSGIFSGSEKRAIHGHDPLFAPSDLAIAPFDYVALGHLHRFQNVSTNNIPVIYSGSPERIDFGERKEEKGFCLVTIENKQKTTYEFIKTPQRSFIQIEVELHEQTKIMQTQEIIKAVEKHDITNAIIKIVYHVPAHIQDMVDLPMIQRACAKALDVVAVIPVHHIKERTQRRSVNVDMGFEQLFETYIDQKTELKERKKGLLEKALLFKEMAQKEQ